MYDKCSDPINVSLEINLVVLLFSYSIYCVFKYIIILLFI